ISSQFSPLLTLPNISGSWDDPYGLDSSAILVHTTGHGKMGKHLISRFSKNHLSPIVPKQINDL
ncbi:hypothetical protein PMAYCL1PPCAC_23076, partial [Pristionchus mayeri]